MRKGILFIGLIVVLLGGFLVIMRSLSGGDMSMSGILDRLRLSYPDRSGKEADQILGISNLIIIIIGGLGTTVGPIFGVLFIRLLQQLITQISPVMEGALPNLPAGFTTGIGPMVFGLAIILFLILEPRGLAHRWSLVRASYRLWPF